ncbi:hypothetical protein TNCV_702111 [Trichonephila clavipes]|nr:hypothetical protein TNCV_702111 [Trichonephila clavipes]
MLQTHNNHPKRLDETIEVFRGKTFLYTFHCTEREIASRNILRSDRNIIPSVSFMSGKLQNLTFGTRKSSERQECHKCTQFSIELKARTHQQETKDNSLQE